MILKPVLVDCFSSKSALETVNQKDEIIKRLHYITKQ